MSLQNQDVRTAEQVFSQVFVEEDKKVKKELVNEFLQGFLMEYPRYRKRFQSGAGTEVTLDALEQSKVQLTGGRSLKSASELYLAKNLGRSLGIFLAAVEYGITSPMFNVNGDAPLRATMIASQIAIKLKMLGKKVDPVFIEMRIEAIAKKNRAHLSESQQRLLTSMAAAFLR